MRPFKHISLILCLLAGFGLTGQVQAQGIGIGTTAPDPSAKVEISDTARGLLIPRLTTTQRDAIPNPATGLLIFNTTTNCFEFWSGLVWLELCGNCGIGSPSLVSNSPVCEGDTLFLMATGPLGATYEWSGPNGFSSTAQNPVIENVTSVHEGSYSATATLNGCESDAAYTSVSMSPQLANLGAISGNSTVCENATGESYAVPTVSGATDYEWVVPTGANITAGQGTNNISVNFGTTAGNVEVYAHSVCDTTDTTTLAISFLQLAITQQPENDTVCNGQAASFSVAASGTGLSYQWQENSGSGWTSLTNSGVYSGVTTSSLGISSVSASMDGNSYRCRVNNACGSNNSVSVDLVVNTGVQGQIAFGESGDDYAYDIKATPDGGYIVAGQTDSYGGSGFDAFMTKLNAVGVVEWSKTYGGSSADGANTVALTSDGGFIIGGSTSSYGSTGDIYLIKTDDAGTVDWTKTYDVGAGKDGNGAFKVIQDGSDYVIGGTFYKNGEHKQWIILKVDDDGDVLWAKTYGTGGLQNDECHNLIKTSDGGYLFSGHPATSGLPAMLVKTDVNGNVSWAKTYNFPGNWTRPWGLIEDSNGDIVFFGQSDGHGVMLVKLNSAGSIIYAKGNITTNSWVGRASALFQASDGNYIATGTTQDYGAGSHDMMIMKYTQAGNLLWTKTYGNTGSDLGMAAVESLSGDGIVALGYTTSFGAGNNDAYLVFTDNDGVSNCNETTPSLSPGNINAGTSNISMSNISITTNSGVTENNVTMQEVIECNSCL